MVEDVGNSEELSLQGSLGEVLRKHRKACGLNQQDVADVLERSVSTVSKMESGIHAVDMDTLGKVARLFKTTAVRLVWESEQVRLRANPVTEKLIPILDKLLAGLEQDGLSP